MSATTMTLAEEIAGLAGCLKRADDAASDASMHFDDVRSGDWPGAKKLGEEEIPSEEMARLLGMAYAARKSANDALREADNTLAFLLRAYQAVAADDDLPPLGVS
jgi:hypothetical protein